MSYLHVLRFAPRALKASLLSPEGSEEAMNARLGRFSWVNWVSRKQMIAGLLVLLLIAGGVFLFTRSDTSPNGSGGIEAVEGLGDVEVPQTGVNAAAYFEGDPTQLVYASGAVVEKVNVSGDTSDSDGFISRLPEVSLVSASLGSDHLAYVVVEEGSDESQTLVPTLHVLDPTSDPGDERTIGPGLSPLWMSTGSVLAYLRPVGANPDCTLESCPGETEVVLYSPSTGQQEVLVEAGAWELIDWAGDRLFLSDRSEEKRLLSVSLTGETEEMELRASRVMDASPDGKWVLFSTNDGVQMRAVEAGVIAEKGESISVSGTVIIGATWSPDSTRVAAVTEQIDSAERAKGQKKGKAGPDTVSTSEVITFTPESLEPVPMEETLGARPPLLWSADSTSLAFPRLVDQQAGLLQASYCPVEEEGACRVFVSWTVGISLLRME